MNPNLSGPQFSQPSLPSLEDVGYERQPLRLNTKGATFRGDADPDAPLKLQAKGGYTSAHYMAGSWEDNPNFTPEAEGDYLRSADKFFDIVEEDGWANSWEIESPQRDVKTSAVDHLVENSTGLEANLPDIRVTRGRDRDWINDGNHRLLAAQRRGQMFVPTTTLEANPPKKWTRTLQDL